MIDYSSINIRTWSRLGSCGAFGVASMELPQINDKVVMLTSDLCTFSGLDRFKQKYPEYLYNFGIAEQNMVGVAGGFAKEGFIPFATTYATFASMRCADQVKVNMGYMNLPIKLIGLTSGFSVGILGATHMSLEDISIMRSIPNLVILSPADCTSTVKATLACLETKSPVYLRLTGTMNNPIVYKSDFDFQIGKANVLREGSDIVIIATGSMVYNSLKVAEKLEEKGISVKVVDMHTIKPLDIDVIKQASRSKLIVSIEEHSKFGGLGSAIAENLSSIKNVSPLLIIGTKDQYLHASSYMDLLEKSGLTVEKIYNQIFNFYKEL